MKCACGSGLIAGLNGRCVECNRSASLKGWASRKRLTRECVSGIEARLAKARAALAHDPNVDPFDAKAGDVVVECQSPIGYLPETPVGDAWNAWNGLLYGGRWHIEGFSVRIAPEHEHGRLAVAGMGGGSLC